ncbi:YybH family protein [Pseudonocardia acaciae]|uniref:YybH family protein n=1 Tax=Pseudonocardia acaciae TaxID=551276 RepID=UPI000B0D11EF|nr:nuclear transport factor 2 family protein [Pseudonocardia acaciae]
MPPTSAEREVLRAIGAFTRAIEAHDVEGIVAAWDDQADTVVYQPEEDAAPLLSVAEIRAYAATLHSFFAHAHDVALLDKKVLFLDDRAAHVYLRFWCGLELASGRRIDGQIRQSFALVKRDDGWRIAHYHESRKTPGFDRPPHDP